MQAVEHQELRLVTRLLDLKTKDEKAEGSEETQMLTMIRLKMVE
jgi:hypothetical protein